MKKNYFKTWGLLSLLLVLFASTAMAQTDDTPPAGTPSIKFKVGTRAVLMNLFANEDNTPIWINTGEEGVYEKKTIGTKGMPSVKTTAKNGEITIYGKVTKAKCKNRFGNLTGVDVSQNTALEELDVTYSDITELDLSANTNLKKVVAMGCRLNTVKFAPNAALEEVDFSRNLKLEAVDFSNLPHLKTVNLMSCIKLVSPKFDNCPALTAMVLDGTKNVLLDLSAMTNLEGLSAANCGIKDMKLPTGDSKLKMMVISGNFLDACTLDKIFRALPTIPTSDVVNLSIIDNKAAPTANTKLATDKGWKVDVTGDATGCEDATTPPDGCPVAIITATKKALVQFKVKVAKELDIWVETEPNVFKKLVAKEGKKLKESTEPTYPEEYFEERAVNGTLKVYGYVLGFDCKGNGTKVIGLDVTGMPQLEDVFCQENNISTIDLSKNTALQTLVVHDNALQEINLAANTKLEMFAGSRNKFTALDFTANTALTIALCNENLLDACALNDMYKSLNDKEVKKTLDIKGNPGVEASYTKVATEKYWQTDAVGDGTGCGNPGLTDGIENVSADGMKIAYNGNKIVVSNAKQNVKVMLYANNGTKMVEAYTDNEGQYTLDLNKVNKGHYIVFVNGKGYSILVK